MKKIDFIVIGAMKSGTTSIVNILNQSSHICISKVKEPNFFLKNKFSVVDTENDYHQLFDFNESLNTKYGEASTTYTFFPEYQNVAQSIFEYNPKIKLIYILRDPVKRIESNYAFRLSRKVNKYTDPYKEILSDPSYLNRSRYDIQLRQYLEYFKKEQILLIPFEDFLSDKQSFFKQIIQFLGIDPKEVEIMNHDIWMNKSDEIERISPTGIMIGNNKLARMIPDNLKKPIKKMFTVKLDEKPTLPKDLKKTLFNLLIHDIEAIETRLNRKLSEWRNY